MGREAAVGGGEVGVQWAASGETRRGDGVMGGVITDTFAYIRGSVMGTSTSAGTAPGPASPANAAAGTTAAAGPKLGLSGKKICCACPETRKARDTCTVTANGDPEEVCRAAIEAHNACLRADGFHV